MLYYVAQDNYKLNCPLLNHLLHVLTVPISSHPCAPFSAYCMKKKKRATFFAPFDNGKIRQQKWPQIQFQESTTDPRAPPPPACYVLCCGLVWSGHSLQLVAIIGPASVFLGRRPSDKTWDQDLCLTGVSYSTAPTETKSLKYTAH